MTYEYRADLTGTLAFLTKERTPASAVHKLRQDLTDFGIDVRRLRFLTPALFSAGDGCEVITVVKGCIAYPTESGNRKQVETELLTRFQQVHASANALRFQNSRLVRVKKEI